MSILKADTLRPIHPKYCRQQRGNKTLQQIIPNWLRVSLTQRIHVHVNRRTYSQSNRTHLQRKRQYCDVDRCHQFVSVQTACNTLHTQHRMIQRTAPTCCTNSLCPHELPPLDSAAAFYAASSLHADNIKQPTISNNQQSSWSMGHLIKKRSDLFFTRKFGHRLIDLMNTNFQAVTCIQSKTNQHLQPECHQFMPKTKLNLSNSV